MREAFASVEVGAVLGIGGQRLVALVSDVGDEDVFGVVELGLVEDPLSVGAVRFAVVLVEVVAELDTDDGAGPGVVGCKPRLQVQLATPTIMLATLLGGALKTSW